jgi:hypothetical protein
LRPQYQGTLSHPTPFIIPLNHKTHRIPANDPKVIYIWGHVASFQRIYILRRESIELMLESVPVKWACPQQGFVCSPVV